MNAPASHPSDYALDRGGPAVAAHLEICAACQGRAAAAAAARRAFETEVFPATVASVQARAHKSAPARRARRLWLVAPLAAAAAAVLIMARGLLPSSGGRGDGYFGTKG